MSVIESVVPDPLVHRQRLRVRDRGLAIPEPTSVALEARRQERLEWPEPHLVLDGLTSPGTNLRKALAYLR